MSILTEFFIKNLLLHWADEVCHRHQGLRRSRISRSGSEDEGHEVLLGHGLPVPRSQMILSD